MRQDLRAVEGRPDHIGLAYGAWAPVVGGPDIPQDKRGKVPDGDRAKWLAALAGYEVAPDYAAAFARWKESYRPPRDYLADVTLSGRLLVGHGNASATEVGLTVHHTWGVPYIPGSALKGLLAHYIDATYGPGNALPPWQQQGPDDTERARWQGVTWDGSRIKRGPGDLYRALFGAPDAEQDDEMRTHGLVAGAARGHVVFHDALYVPGSVVDPNGRDGRPTTDTPFAVDVLTVHQKRYYDNADKAPQPWPCDYDDPNPVQFLSVRPGARFLLALSGPTDWTELAGALLCDALADWGVGGKTAAGYGHGKVGEWKRAALPPSPVLGQLRDFLENPPQVDGNKPTARQLLGMVQEQWLDRLLQLPHEHRERAAALIETKIKSKAVRTDRDELITRLIAGPA